MLPSLGQHLDVRRNVARKADVMHRALQSQRVSAILLSQGRQLLDTRWQSQLVLGAHALPALTAAFTTSPVTSAGFSPSLNTPVDPSFLQRRLPPNNYGIRYCVSVRVLKLSVSEDNIYVTNFCRIVPEKTAYVVERFGKFNKTLSPGIHLLIPFVRAWRRLPMRYDSECTSSKMLSKVGLCRLIA